MIWTWDNVNEVFEKEKCPSDCPYLETWLDDMGWSVECLLMTQVNRNSDPEFCAGMRVAEEEEEEDEDEE